MSEGPGGRYWCHACNQLVNPVVEPELKCPLCDDGFVEEMESSELNDSGSGSDSVGSDRSLALWAPILLELLGGSSRPSGSRREANDQDSDLDREFENFVQRRRRRSAIIQLLQSLQDDLRSGISSLEGGAERGRERERDRDRESLILINNPFNQAIILRGSLESNNRGAGASPGDYFIGPGLEILLQHLADNDPNRYGTPPAKKEAVDALPTVRIEEAICCSVCLDDFDIGLEAKEMPCKHKFHSECILPWLQLHSSCPVCRSRLPADESKISNGASNSSRMEVTDGGRGDHNDFWVPVPWPFNGIFSLSASQNSANSTSNPPPSSSSSSSSNSGNSNSHSEEN